MIKNFRHACILVSDLDRALKFYGDVLGLRVCRFSNYIVCFGYDPDKNLIEFVEDLKKK
ncbi:MAG: VOC family protein [Candidatus Omnitrophota bacterium]